MTHSVGHAGKRLGVEALDVAAPPEGILGQVEALAGRVLRLRKKGKGAPESRGRPFGYHSRPRSGPARRDRRWGASP